MTFFVQLHDNNVLMVGETKVTPHLLEICMIMMPWIYHHIHEYKVWESAQVISCTMCRYHHSWVWVAIISQVFCWQRQPHMSQQYRLIYFVTPFKYQLSVQYYIFQVQTPSWITTCQYWRIVTHVKISQFSFRWGWHSLRWCFTFSWPNWMQLICPVGKRYLELHTV